MVRYFVQAYLDSFFTKTSGDIIGQGEFYFKCNGKRYPDKGVLLLKANSTFNPEPNPVMFSAVLDEKEKKVKFDVEVWEEDVGRDDKFLDQNFDLPLKPMNQNFDLKDKKGKVLIKIIVKIEEAKGF